MEFTFNNKWQFINFKQYAAFGETTLDTLGVTRQGYIGKEKDVENGLGDHGVRKYDYETGRFNSHDVLWEKYRGWNSYQYCMNNPIWAKDWDGKIIMSKKDQEQYKQLTAIARDIFPQLAENKDLMNAISKFTKRSVTHVKEAFQFNSGPNMYIKYLPSSFRALTHNWKEFTINTGDVKAFEAKRLDWEPSQEVYDLDVIRLMLHEVVETLDQGSKRPNSAECVGSVFEKLYFGKVISTFTDAKNNADLIKSKLNIEGNKAGGEK